MATKVELRGRLEKIMPGKNIKTGYVCELIIFTPAGKDEFGATRGKDQHFPVTHFTESYARVQENISHMVGKPVVAECYLNGNEFTGQNGLAYSLKLNLKSITLYQKA